jgi:TetR/AcrR family transcriptional regulator, cholesterol catabolism regulator
LETEQIGGRNKSNGRKDDRLKQIARTAVTLFYKNGYLQTSTRQIAEACGISQSNLYYYIKSKEDFLDIFVKMTTDAFYETTGEVQQRLDTISPAEVLRKAIRNNLTIVDSNQDMVLFWYQESKTMGKEHFIKLMERELHIVNLYRLIIEEGCKRGEFHPKDTMLAAYDILILCDMWALKRWYLRKHYTLEDYITRCEAAALSIAIGKDGQQPGPV